jgi:hypothetical protein
VIEPQIADAFRPYLKPGERIVWTGQPQRGLLFTPRDLFLVPFSVVWLGFVAFWETSVVHMSAPLFFKVWGALFLAVGLFFLVGRFALDAWVRARTVYAMTNERALILRWVMGSRLLSANLFGSVRLSRSGETRGTLEFTRLTDDWVGKGLSLLGRRQDLTIWTPSLSNRVQFLGIDDVMEAYRFATAAPVP